MKRLSLMFAYVLFLCLLTACGADHSAEQALEQVPPSADSSEPAIPNGSPEPDNTSFSDQLEDTEPNTEEDTDMPDEIKVKITVDETELTAVFEDNITSRALVEQMPMTLPMMDLYGREMCYRYGGGTFETDALRYDRYEVGDIAYWPPAGSLVILYKQNGEEFERQQIGHIDEGMDVFDNIGDVDVTFELVED